MPIFNAERFLNCAIESIRAQSLEDFELILIDDGSTDGSAGIMERHAAEDARILLHSVPHGGVARALNRGLAVARSGLVASMNADDIAAPARLTRQVAYMETYLEIAALGTAAKVIAADGTILGHSAPETDPACIRDGLLKFNLLAHPTVMMRRDHVVAAGGYRPIFRAAEDYDLWLRLSERHALANLPEELLTYRTHAEQATARLWRLGTLEALGAQQAARLRRAGRGDPLEHFTRVDARTLRAIGLGRSTIAAALDGQQIAAPPLPARAEPVQRSTIGRWFRSTAARR